MKANELYELSNEKSKELIYKLQSGELKFPSQKSFLFEEQITKITEEERIAIKEDIQKFRDNLRKQIEAIEKEEVGSKWSHL